MALNTRELYLILKARDEASRTIRAFGGNLGRLGALQQRVNAAQTKAAAAQADQRKAIARAEVAVQEAKTAKIVSLLEEQGKVDAAQTKLKEARDTRATSLAIEQTRIAEANIEKLAVKTEYLAAVQSGATDKEIASIRVRVRAQEVATQKIILSAKEQILAIKDVARANIQTATQELDAAKASMAAARERGDAAVKSAEAEVAAQRRIQAALRETSMAEIATAKSAVASQVRRQEVAQRRLATGTSVMTTGVLTAAVGAIGIAELNKATNAASQYASAVARTKTQVDGVRISSAQLGREGTNVATSLAVDFDKVQPTLYDIFSSIDVNAPQSARLLRTIGTASVAGAADMQVAGQAIITILNAYKLKAKDATHVSDVLFQLVRKGVGTYQQFSSTIGRSIPSAINANQSLASLSGVLAFLTRNGLSAATAAASAGRAFDTLANPKAEAALRNLGTVAKGAIDEVSGKGTAAKLQAAGVNFKQMGVNVLDASGNIKPVVTIIAELRKQFQGLTKEQKAATLKEAFKGAGGTIQAMRFFNHALNDTHNLLPELTNDMKHVSGATKHAYDIMSNTPEAKIQLMKNRFKALSITIGQDLIPVKLKLVTILGHIVGWFTKLSPEVKKMIAYTLAFVSAVLVLVGVLAILAGMFLVVAAGVELLEANFAAIAVGFAELLVAAAVILIIVKYHKQLFAAAKTVWNGFLDLMKPVIDEWHKLEPILVNGAKNIEKAFLSLLTGVSGDSGDIGNILKALGTVVVGAMLTIEKVVEFAWPVISNIIVSAITIIKPILLILISILGTLSGVFNSLPSAAKVAVLAIGLVAFAMRGFIATSAAGAAFTEFGAAFSTMATGMIARAGGLKTALAAVGVGAVIGTEAGKNIKGKKGILTGALGGAAGGAAVGAGIGAFFGGVGAGPGALLGGAIGGVTGLVTAWNSQKSAADDAKTAGVAALKAQADAADQLATSLSQINGLYDSQFKKQLVSGLAQGKNGGTLGTLTKAGINTTDIANTIIGGKGTSGLNDLRTSLFAAAAAGKITKAQMYAASAAITSLADATSEGETKTQAENKATGDSILRFKQLGITVGKLADAFKKNGVYTKGGKNQLDDYTAAGKRNSEIVGENVRQLGVLAGKELAHGKSVKQVAKDYTTQVATLRANLKQLGFNSTAISGIIKQYGHVPKRVATTLLTQSAKARADILSLQTKINLIKQGHVPGLDANSTAGKAKIAELQARINALKGKVVDATVNVNGLTPLQVALANINALPSHKTTQIDINTMHNDYVNKYKSFHPDGGSNHAAGGWITGPGTTTSDSIHAMLSNKEFVVNAKAAQKNRAWLEAINSGHVQHFKNGGSVGSGSGTISTIVSYLQGLGFTRAGIAATLGNWKIESGFDPNAYNANENAHGFAQWERGRWTALQAYARNHHMNPTSTAAELGYFKHELKHGYGSTLSEMRNTHNARNAAAFFDQHFEGSSGSTRAQRVSAAAGYYSDLKNKTIIPGPDGTKITTGDDSGPIPAGAKRIKNVSTTISKLKNGKTSKHTSVDYDYKYRGHIYSTLKALRSHIASVKKSLSDTGFGSFLTNYKKSTKDFVKAEHSLINDVADAGGNAKLVKYMRNRSKLLERDVANLNKYNKRLKSAESDLSGMRQSKASLFNSVKSAVTGTFSIGSEQGSFSDISGDLNQDVSDAKTFLADINKLKAKGYSKNVIADLYAQGPSALPTIESLLQATPAGAKKFSDQYAQLGKYGTQAGRVVSGAMYDAGIQAAAGLVRGLRSKIKSLNAVMSEIALTMIRKIKEELGIKSPSKIFHAIGNMMMRGWHNGIKEGAKSVHSVMNDTTTQLMDNAWSAPVGGSRGRGPEMGGNTYNHKKVVFEKGSIVTQEINPVKHAADLGWEISRRVG